MPLNGKKTKNRYCDVQKILLAVVYFPLLIAGCATSLIPVSRYVEPISTHKVGKEPQLGMLTQRSVGDPIYAEYDYIETEREGARVQEAARLIDGYVGGFALGQVKIEPGTLLLAFSDGKAKQYCTANRSYFDLLVGPYDIVCFSDSDDGETFDRIRVPNIMLGKWRSLNPLLFKKETLEERIGNASGQRVERGFKFELLYQGVSNGTFKIAYREYIDNLARPAFYQEVTYILNESGGADISFKEVEIEVLKADNNQITYQVKRGFRAR